MSSRLQAGGMPVVQGWREYGAHTLVRPWPLQGCRQKSSSGSRSCPDPWGCRPFDDQFVDLRVAGREVEALDPLAVQADIDRKRDRRNGSPRPPAAAPPPRAGTSLSFFRFSRGDVTPRLWSPAFTGTRNL